MGPFLRKKAPQKLSGGAFWHIRFFARKNLAIGNYRLAGILVGYVTIHCPPSRHERGTGA